MVSMHCIITVSIIHLIIVYSVTAEKWVPIIEVPVDSIKTYLEKKKRQGFSILGLEQTANSVPLDQYVFPKKMVSCVSNSNLPAVLISCCKIGVHVSMRCCNNS
jgi:tRNA G18 (ribose-2'-O)-methylase SpoU